jgi:hypothetical protein
MASIDKDTTVKVSVGILVAIIVYLAQAQWAAFEIIAEVHANTKLTATFPAYMTRQEGMELMIASNATAIKEISKSNRLGRLDRDLSNRRKERRDLQRALRSDPTNELIAEQIESIQEEIDVFQRIRDCVVRDGSPCQ